MNNDEMLIVIKDLFEKKIDEVKDLFEKKIDEVKTHSTVMFEKLDSKIKIIAEGHVVLNEKIDNLSNKVDKLESRVDSLSNKVDKLEGKVNTMNTDLCTVKNYVIGVDKKLNEHDII